MIFIIKLYNFSLIQITQWTAYLSDESNYAPSSNTTCSIDLRDIGLQFLNNCHEVNHVHFKHSLILSSSFILGESFLSIAIDRIGRQLSIGKYIQPLKGHSGSGPRKKANFHYFLIQYSIH